MSITNKEIEIDLIQYLKNGNPVLAKLKDIPMNDSLVELGYIDSFGIIDLVTYFENKWTKEKGLKMKKYMHRSIVIGEAVYHIGGGDYYGGTPKYISWFPSPSISP